MLDPIDVDKLKNEAISAIDLLFGEDEDDDSMSGEALEPTIEQAASDELVSEEFDNSIFEQDQEDDSTSDVFAEPIFEQTSDDDAISFEFAEPVDEPSTEDDPFSVGFSEPAIEETLEEEPTVDVFDDPVFKPVSDVQDMVADSAAPVVEKSTDKQEMVVNFTTLQEDLMTIDWEYSDERINSFIGNLNTILDQYSDKYNQALLKMIKSIVSYLGKARDKAYPETLNVLPGIIDSLQEINSGEFNTQKISERVKSDYKKVLTLRYNISQYNQYIRRKASLEPQKSPAVFYEVRPTSDIQSDAYRELIAKMETHEKRIARLEEQNQKLKQVILDMRNEAPPVAISEPAPVAISEPAPVAIEEPEPFDLSEPEQEITFGKTEFEPEQDVETVSFDEIDDNEDDFVFDESEIEALDTEDVQLDDGESFSLSDDEDGFDSDITFGQSNEEDGDLLSDDDLSYDDLETISEVELEYDGEDAAGATIEDAEPEDAVSEDEEPVVDLIETEQEDVETVENEEHYMQCCKIGSETIAFSEDTVNNIYKIPSKLLANINDILTIQLGELSSGFFFKLSKGMRGTLGELSNKELKKMTATVKHLRNDVDDYSHVALCACGQDDLIVIPISENLDLQSVSVDDIKQMSNDFSDEIVNVEDIGTIPLVDPCKFYG